MTNRELALSVWMLITLIMLLIWSIKNISLRKSIIILFKEVVKSFRYSIMQFLFVYTLTALVLFIYLVYRWEFNSSLIFTFLIFTLLSYIPIILNIIFGNDEAYDSKSYFRQAFSVWVLGVGLVSAQTFNFYIEFLIIVPLLILLGIIKEVPNQNGSPKAIENFADNFISFIGVIILINWAVQFIRNISDILTLDFWLSLTIDFWGILIYIPAILLLPHFLFVERNVRWYNSSSHVDYIRIPLIYLALRKKYKRRKKICTFSIYKIDSKSRPFQEFSIYGEIDKDVNMKRLNYDIQTYILKLRSGNFNDYDKIENRSIVPNQYLNIYSDVIYVYLSIKGGKRYYPWHKSYIWRNPRLNQRYKPKPSNWIELGDGLLVDSM